MTSRQHTKGDIVAERYVVKRYVGEGGMQEVYCAEDVKLNRAVALKVPKNKSAIKRFQRSAAMSAKVTHPNVAKTLDYLEDAEGQYLVEEFIVGEDLKSRLDTYFDVLDPHLAAHVFHHLASGVNAVHSVGVFHRDLKPSNIMVSCDPNVSAIKVTDFGIAKMAEDEIEKALKDSESTMASLTAVGALPYMAPELIEDSQKATLASDVWSLGAILYQLLAGDPPYGSGLSAVAKILEAAEPSIPALLESKQEFRPVSTELWGIVLNCLQRDPSRRPSAEALVKSCGKLCYSTAIRFEGEVSAYPMKGKNWGFIEESGSHRSVFFPLKNYYGRRPKVGQKVIAAACPGYPKPRAYPILPLRLSD